MTRYRIVVADDHAMFRAGLKRVLSESADIEILGEAGDGLALLKLLNQISPDLIILDISMPNLRGIETIQEIRKIHPGIKVLILTMHKDMDFLREAFSAGANGYLLKEEEETEIFSAIETIRNGKTYVSTRVFGDLTEDWTQIHRKDRGSPFGEDLTITTREKEVLKLIAEGKSNQEIADLLFISVHTVQRHRAHIMEKLGLRKTADLVRYAIQKGYL